MLLLLDNLDSFTYNLVQLFMEYGIQVVVKRSHVATVKECLALVPNHIVISPGPGHPRESGISKKLIEAAEKNKIPLLGVCLGHQCLAEVFGGKVEKAEVPVHGKLSAIRHNEKGIFSKIPNPFLATRYHSLLVSQLPDCLEACAWTDDKHIMAINHKHLHLYGVQFHPESIASQFGDLLFKNFLKAHYD